MPGASPDSSGAPAKMRVLIVTFAFPPSNVIGAIHVGKLARYLDRRGHDVRVVTTDVIEDRSLPLEIPRERVIYTDYPKSKSSLGFLVRPFRQRSTEFNSNPGDAPPSDSAPGRSLWRELHRHYVGLIHIPDMRASWARTAVPAGRKLIEAWRPDIIYASSPPHTGLIIANRLARSFGIPWVAGLRDLWVDNPYHKRQ